MEEQKRGGLGDNALFGDVVSTLRFFGDQGHRRARRGRLRLRARPQQGSQIEFVLAQHGIEAASAIIHPAGRGAGAAFASQAAGSSPAGVVEFR
jgi:hypothetical protein